MKTNRQRDYSPSDQNSYGSYGGYGNRSPAKISGAINEFEDNLNIDWDDRYEDDYYSSDRFIPGRDQPCDNGQDDNYQVGRQDYRSYNESDYDGLENEEADLELWYVESQENDRYRERYERSPEGQRNEGYRIGRKSGYKY